MANDVGYPVVQFSVDTSGSVYSAINYHHDAGLGENELYADNDIVFDIFPNPASTSIYCRILKAEVSGELYIYDLSGRQIQSLPVAGNQQLKIDVSEYPAGLYHIILNGQNGTFAQKKFIVR